MLTPVFQGRVIRAIPAKGRSGSPALAARAILVVEHFSFVFEANSLLDIDKHLADGSLVHLIFLQQ